MNISMHFLSNMRRILESQQLKELVEPTTDYLYTRSESPHKLPWWAIRVHRLAIGTVEEWETLCAQSKGFCQWHDYYHCNHNRTLRCPWDIDAACRDLGTRLNPATCVPTPVEKGKILPKATFHLAEGDTRNISEAPTQFLGQTWAASPTLSKRVASAKLKAIITDGLKMIDRHPVCGKLKLWILRHYLIHFQLMVNQTQSTTIAALESLTAKFIRKWLGFPRNATRAIIFHPSVLKTPSLASTKLKSKLSLLASLSCSTDPATRSEHHVKWFPGDVWRSGISPAILELYQEAEQRQPKNCRR